MSLYEFGRQIRALRDGGLPVSVDDILDAIERQDRLPEADASDVVWSVGHACRQRLRREGKRG